MADRRTTTSCLFLALTAVSAVAVPVVLYLVSARAVDHPAPDLWWLLLLPLAPGAVAATTARSRVATAAAVLGIVAATTYAGLLAAYAGETRAGQELDARQYDERCNTSTSGLSVPFHVNNAFTNMGRVEAHHLHGPDGGGLYGCTMAVAGEQDEAFAAWRDQLLGSGWRVERDDSEVWVVRRGVELQLYVVDDSVFLTALEAGTDPCRSGRPDSLEVEEPGDDEVAIASPPCS